LVEESFVYVMLSRYICSYLEVYEVLFIVVQTSGWITLNLGWW